MEKKTGLIDFVPQWKCVDDHPDNNRRLHYSRFALSPLLVDEAMTIGVAMRRALLSQVEGISIVSASILGATHEYSTLDGVRESVDEILLNLKQIVLKVAEDACRTSLSLGSCKEEEREYRASIFAQGPGIVTAEHIKFPSSILAVDTDQPVATLLKENQLCIELFIQRGTAKQRNNEKKNYPGFFIDATFTPVQKANFSIHSVGDPKGLQQLLLLEIWTNKTFTPAEALYQAHESLLNLFHKVSPPIPSKKFGSSVSQTPSIVEIVEQIESRKGPEINDISQVNKSIVKDKTDFSTIGSSSDREVEASQFFSIEKKKDSLKPKNTNFIKEHLSSTDGSKAFTHNNLSLDKKTNETLSPESLSIDELELPPRISNCLKRASIYTIADLSKSSSEDLLKIKNFGQKSVEQVNLVLQKRFNLKLVQNR